MSTRRQAKARRPSIRALRTKLDRVDFALLEVLALRGRIAAAIAERKREQGLPDRDPAREHQLIEARRRYGQELV
jgi:chorismate mutase